MKAGMMTLATSPCQCTALEPLAAHVAPTSPPMSAWDELDGMPKYQVIRFQAIAPMSAAKTMFSVVSDELTIPLAIVVATLSDRNAPAKFRSAATVTATRGGSARVAMVVAIAFAVSWNPFVKSNASAVPMTR